MRRVSLVGAVQATNQQPAEAARPQARPVARSADAGELAVRAIARSYAGEAELADASMDGPMLELAALVVTLLPIETGVADKNQYRYNSGSGRVLGE